MASWRKRLAAMAADPKPVGYTYDDAATILQRLGFERAGAGGGSHRIWRRRQPDGTFVRVGLLQSGNGPIPREYIQDMLATLRAAGLIDDGDAR